MSNMNMRATIEPNSAVELQKLYMKRRKQCAARKEEEKIIAAENTEITKMLIDMFREKPYMINAQMIIRDAHIELKKLYTINNKRNNEIEGTINISTYLSSLGTILLTEERAKKFPKETERAVRRLDRLCKTSFKNHIVKGTNNKFFITWDTNTRYSF